MKTTEELRTMLPAEVTAIAGCEEYAGRRDRAWDTLECAHRMATARLERFRPDDPKTLEIERTYAKAERAFSVAVAKLQRERRALLCEPTAPPAVTALDMDTKQLLLPAGVTGAGSFNTKVHDFGRRLNKAIDKPLQTWSDTVHGWSDDQTDATRRAMNVARATLDAAARPFQVERARLVAMKATLTKKKGIRA